MNRMTFALLTSALLISGSWTGWTGEPVTFCAAGDIMLARGCGTMIRRHGMDYPFAEVGSYISLHDFAFANLECPMSSRGRAVANPITFRADSSLVEVLKRSGFDVFSLANNHMLDYGPVALLDTRRILLEHGFLPVGSGKDASGAHEPVIVEKRGTKAAFLAYVDVYGFGPIMAKDRPVPAFLDSAGVQEDIGRARPLADIVIVSVHWGTEYVDHPTERQTAFAHLMIDSGADIVIGHHPHVLQSIEKYKGKFIFYSLGNFVFDQPHLLERESVIFSCVFRDGRIISPCVTPVFMLEKAFRPVFPDCVEVKNLTERIKKISDGMGVKFRDGDTVLYLE